jgi:hypothetical protein
MASRIFYEAACGRNQIIKHKGHKLGLQEDVSRQLIRPSSISLRNITKVWRIVFLHIPAQEHVESLTNKGMMAFIFFELQPNYGTALCITHIPETTHEQDR